MQQQLRTEEGLGLSLYGDITLCDVAAKQLRRRGFRYSGPGSLVLALTTDYLDPFLEHLAQGTALALVSLSEVKRWLGPILIPGQTACYQCFSSALVENNYVSPKQERAGRHQRIALSRMAEWLKGWTSGEERVIDCVREITPSGELGPPQRIRRRQQCVSCGGPHSDPGTLQSEITGICSPVSVRRFGRVWLARSSQQLRHPHGPTLEVAGLRHPVLGRGLSRKAAIAGCLAEAIERYSLYRSGHEQLVVSSFRKIEDQAIHPHRLLLFSERQYQYRDLWNRAGATPFWVPPRFNPDSVIDWVRAEPLFGASPRLVPADYCFYNGRPLFCVADSNGCAAGPTLEEAITAGLLELMERDAVSIWWYNRIARPQPLIDFEDLPHLRGLRRYLQKRDRVIRAFDITTDLGVPVIAAVTALSDGSEILMGTACHPDPETALSKAVLEACQMLVASDSKGRVNREDFPFGQEWLETARLDREPHLSPADSAPRAIHGKAAATHLETCSIALRRAGLEAYYVDLTRPELGLRVARVLVPGLRGWTPRFAPGRLYDVPVRLGWRKRRTSELKLNAWPWFL